VSASFSCLCLC